jgi:nitrogen fixation protein FixH
MTMTTEISNPLRRGLRRPKEVTGRTVFVCLVAFFAVVAGVNAIMIRAAVSTFSGIETESAYQAGLAFEQEAAAVGTQEALGWHVSAKITPTANGATRIDVSANDAESYPLPDLRATARLVHPTDARADYLVDLHAGALGAFDGTVQGLHGQWDLIIDLSRAGKRMFRSKNRIVLR